MNLHLETFENDELITAEEKEAYEEQGAYQERVDAGAHPDDCMGNCCMGA